MVRVVPSIASRNPKNGDDGDLNATWGAGIIGIVMGIYGQIITTSARGHPTKR